MRIIAAYVMAVLGGNKNPSVKDIKNILGAVGITAEDDAISQLIAKLDGKSLDELIAAGTSSLCAGTGGGGGGGGSAAAAAPAAGGAAPAGKAPAAKEPEPEEEEAGDMGFSLFD